MKAYGRKQRAQRARVAHEPYDVREVYETGRWLCGLCGKPIDPLLKYPHRGSASIDHVVPLSAGGSDSRDNVQPAHLHCNRSKGARSAPLTVYKETA